MDLTCHIAISVYSHGTHSQSRAQTLKPLTLHCAAISRSATLRNRSCRDTSSVECGSALPHRDIGLLATWDALAVQGTNPKTLNPKTLYCAAISRKATLRNHSCTNTSSVECGSALPHRDISLLAAWDAPAVQGTNPKTLNTKTLNPTLRCYIP